MIENKELDDRHTLPRWVSIRKAVEGGIFARPGVVRKATQRSAVQEENEGALLEEFKRRIDDWLESQSYTDAEELISVSLFLGRENDVEIQQAAATLVGSELASEAARNLAGRILSGDVRRLSWGDDIAIASLHKEIRKRKKLIELNPSDALLLTETALCYANLGQLRSSEELLRRALALAPHNRYVLRSAARFYCHLQRPDQALQILRGTPRGDTDPWIRSAELAISGITGEVIRSWRKSKNLVEDDSLSVFDRSELATEIATLEFSSGSSRAGLRKVRFAALDPTENAVAQIEFLAERTGSFRREQFFPDISRAMEARALSSYWKGEVRAALDACEAWQEIEPFSVRPAIFGSFLATAKGNSIERGIALARIGLVGNPGNLSLLNNIAVLYAYIGNVDLAASFLGKARASPDMGGQIASLATEGLIKFRSGDPESGLEHYEKAIELAVIERRSDLALRAFSFLAKEMCRVDPGMKSYFIEEFGVIEKKLKRGGAVMPRDVYLIWEELRPTDKDFSGQKHYPSLVSRDLLEGILPSID